MLHLQTLVTLPRRQLRVIVAKLAMTSSSGSSLTVNYTAAQPETTSYTGTQQQQTYVAAGDQQGRTPETNSARHPYRTKELPATTGSSLA
uniref:Uncharacterized protein n=1 Tax=Oryza rufipogon TaxID=4529 RepID=A0A0E0RH20_ORYRU